MKFSQCSAISLLAAVQLAAAFTPMSMRIPYRMPVTAVGRGSLPLSEAVSSSVDISSSSEGQVSNGPHKFGLADIRKAIPEKAFEKNVWKSLFYMLFDYSMWGGSFVAIHALVNSSLWSTLPFWAQAAASLLYWNVAGFFMWCIFVVGHDCGHGTFSDNKLLNNILGHFMHGSILVPFFPWQLSHRRHHMFHNHVEKDYSYSWLTPEVEAREDSKITAFFESAPVLKFFLPFYGWFMYLLGVKDGSHFLPIKSHRLWTNTPQVERTKCLISTAVVGAFAVASWFIFGQSLSSLAYYYLAPLVMFGWWLVTVTYLQHHHEDSIVYDEDNWKFMDSAFETVDRTYGLGIDRLHHHISDGHVVHHLFYTLIPHYNLKLATSALQTFLKSQDASHLYRHEETRDFPLRVHDYLVRKGFRARLATSSPPV